MTSDTPSTPETLILLNPKLLEDRDLGKGAMVVKGEINIKLSSTGLRDSTVVWDSVDPVLMLTMPLTSFVTLGKSLNFASI